MRWPMFILYNVGSQSTAAHNVMQYNTHCITNTGAGLPVMPPGGHGVYAGAPAGTQDGVKNEVLFFSPLLDGK